MKREIEVLLKQADGFIDDALNDFRKDRHNLAMVHVEQATQLIIKVGRVV